MRGLRGKIDEMKCHEAARRECPERTEAVGTHQLQVAAVGGSRRSTNP